MNSQEALLTLSLISGLGPTRIRRLLAHFKEAQSVLSASPRELQSVSGIGNETASLIHQWENTVDLTGTLSELNRRELSLLTPDSELWPESLRQQPDAPVLLYVWGKILPKDQHAISIVGSRNTTHYGREVTKQFSFRLAQSGYTIISGLARGIDTHAHEAAIAAKGRTIAVLGSGLAQIYPPENLPLAEKIVSGHGAVITEFPLHQPPDKRTFPQRNRIVAQWGESLLVTEAAHRSGALITANMAADAGKTVFVIPGPIDREHSAGCHFLIRQGATLVTQAEDLVSDRLLNLEAPVTSPISTPEPTLDLTPEERVLYDLLDSQEKTIAFLTQQSGLNSSQVSSSLMTLELKSLIRQLPGMNFVKAS